MLSFIGLSILLAVGFLLRLKIKLLRTLYLPSCVIGGLLGLIIIQGFNYAASGSEGGWVVNVSNQLGLLSAPWEKLPGLLINIVFACLFLGVEIPGLKEVWRRSGPQVAYGQIVAWGQYLVGCIFFLGLVTWLWPELPGMFAGILPVGFEGGHGTAAGLGPVFEKYDWSIGVDFALASATFGILGAIIVGMILVNWAKRKGHVVQKTIELDSMDKREIAEDDSIGVFPPGSRPPAGMLTVRSDAVGAMSLHIAIIGVACLLGFLMKQSLLGIESVIPPLAKLELFQGFPLFPLCMLGGLIIQVFETKYDKYSIIDVGITRRIQNSALDFLVVAAIATIKLDVVATYLVPLLLVVFVGILWNVFCVVFIARRLLPDAWFERSIAEMGQSMGVTATGLLLLRAVDPDYETPAADAFAYKQMIHEPIMGGGLWTGLAIPFLAIKGPLFVLSIVVTVMVVWFIVLFALKMSYGKK